MNNSSSVWFHRLRRRLLQIERGADLGLRKIRGRSEPPTAVCFRTWSPPGELRIHGRVLTGVGGAGRAKAADSSWRNFRGALRALVSHEVPGCLVEVGEGPSAEQTVADEEGYFRLAVDDPRAERGLRHVSVTPEGGPATVAETFVLPADAPLGVVSDIDDTVMHSAVSNPLHAARLALFGNAYTRTPLEGASRLYRNLRAGPQGNQNNPFFYVSSGPWNLYPLVRDFLDHRRFPAGSIAMQDYGFDESKTIFAGHGHKIDRIREILAASGYLPLLLIGDSTQDDPKIYAQLAREHPDRIAAIFIRDVSPAARAATQKLADATSELGTDMLMIRTADEARAYARGHGWIPDAVR